MATASQPTESISNNLRRRPAIESDANWIFDQAAELAELRETQLLRDGRCFDRISRCVVEIVE